MCGIGILVIISQINDFLGFDFMKFNQNIWTFQTFSENEIDNKKGQKTPGSLG